MRSSGVGRHTVVKVQNRQPSIPLTGSGISNLAANLVNKPFVGCNCYYLLVSVAFPQETGMDTPRWIFKVLMT